MYLFVAAGWSQDIFTMHLCMSFMWSISQSRNTLHHVPFQLCHAATFQPAGRRNSPAHCRCNVFISEAVCATVGAVYLQGILTVVKQCMCVCVCVCVCNPRSKFAWLKSCGRTKNRTGWAVCWLFLPNVWLHFFILRFPLFFSVLHQSLTGPLAHCELCKHYPAVFSHGLTGTFSRHFTRELAEEPDGPSG